RSKITNSPKEAVSSKRTIVVGMILRNSTAKRNNFCTAISCRVKQIRNTVGYVSAQHLPPELHPSLHERTTDSEHMERHCIIFGAKCSNGATMGGQLQPADPPS